ncbi:MAG: hypothetical protein E7388_05780 [Ruminococcaceae bacterium]|nr:hypothetical protein [Oscillospiraceae bacterium]
MKKLLKTFMLVLVMVTAVNLVPVGADTITEGEMEPGISPMYIVTASTASSFQISGNVATVTAYYDSFSNFDHANVYIFLQKDVNGTWRAAKSDPNACGWINSSTARMDSFEHTMTFTESGSYRAKFVYYIYNKAGERDVITEYIYRNHTMK